MDKIQGNGGIYPLSHVAGGKPIKKSEKTGTVGNGYSVGISKTQAEMGEIKSNIREMRRLQATQERPLAGEVSEQRTDVKPESPSTILDLVAGKEGESKNISRAGNKSGEVSPRNAKVIEQAFDVLENNRMTIDGHTFTTPSKVVDSVVDYEGKEWLWDSCFHAMVLAEREPGVAKDELRSVMANQEPDGFVPHMNYFRGDGKKLPEHDRKIYAKFLDSPDGAGYPESKRAEFSTTFWTKDDHSDITQPPIVGMAVEEVYKATGDKAYVREMLPGLKGYYNYLHDKRDPDGDNLISIIHPWESGWDHSQRWDETIGVTQGDKPHIGEKKLNVLLNNKMRNWDLDEIFEADKFNVEPVDFNVLYAVNMESLSRLCGEVGDKEGEKMYKSRAEDTKKAIFEKMWDGDKYVDLSGKAEKKSGVKSAAMFYPMMLDGEPHGMELVEKHLMNPKEFNVKYPIPTTSVDHPLYRPDEYWRGNVWQNVNYFVWKGLQKLLEKNPDYVPAKMMAARIKDASFELLDKFGYSEYFDPLKGGGHGAKTFGWNGIVRLMEPDYK